MKIITPFFSIVIPTLNEEHYISNLLKCLEKQKYRDFEVIVVDANSVDKTVGVSKSFSNKLPNLSVLISKKRNLSYQRNLGARRGTGAYLVFFDADIAIPPDYLQKIHKAIIDSNAHFLTTWMRGNIDYFPYPLIMIITNLIVEFSKLIRKPFACGPNIIVYKNAFFEVNGFREDLAMSEDHDLSIKLDKAGYKLKILKEPRLIYSLRRIKTEGFFEVFEKYAMAYTHFIFKGPMVHRYYQYQMGGNIHHRKE